MGCRKSSSSRKSRSSSSSKSMRKGQHFVCPWVYIAAPARLLQPLWIQADDMPWILVLYRGAPSIASSFIASPIRPLIPRSPFSLEPRGRFTFPAKMHPTSEFTHP